MKNKSLKLFDPIALIVITLLMLSGVVIIVMLSTNKPSNLSIAISCFAISLFFIVIGAFCWIKIIIYLIAKPKEVTMFLMDKSYIDTITYLNFIDKKGKKWRYQLPITFTVLEEYNFQINTYYQVLKTPVVILNIIGISDKRFPILKSPKSYWLHMYTLDFYVDEFFLLPLIYFIFLSSIITIIISLNNQAVLIGEIPATLISGFMILYDLIKKIQNKDL
ncbi:MAG: hypothetical protein RR404_04485 [Bacilli bacterium]